MLKKETTGQIAVELMQKDGWKHVDLGCFGMLDEIYSESVKRGAIKDTKHHPLDRQAYIMKLLRHSKFFKKRGYIDYPGYGRQYAKCVVMEIK